MQFSDSHCHLDFAEFKPDLQQLLTQCSQQAIHRCVIPSIAPNNWQTVLNLVQQPDNPVQLFAALGIHPWFLNDLNNSHLNDLSSQVKQHKQHIIAIGEAGIDGKIAEQFNNFDKQMHFFEQQLILAQDEQLPIIIHHRRSHQHIVPLLKQHNVDKTGVIHAFSGSYQQATQYIDLGYKLGVGGTITYPRAKKTINAIKRLPLTSLVLETDAPAMPLAGYQDQRNSPLQITEIFKTLATIRTENEQQLAKQLELNIEDLFNIK